MYIASAKNDFEDYEIQSAKDICVESATCPNLEDLNFFYDEIDQRARRVTDIRPEVTLEFDVSSGTFQAAQDKEKATMVDSPFDELDERLPDKDKIDRSLLAIKYDKKISNSQRLADRLRDLYESVLEDPEEEPLTPGSLINFIYFLSETPRLRYPEVSLTPSNEIRAQWTTAPNRHFAVSFSSMGEARFVIFKPNSDDPDRIDRLSGITSITTLIETTRPHRVLEWTEE